MKVRVLFFGRTNRSDELEHDLRVTWPGGSGVRADVVRATDLNDARLHLGAVPFDVVLLDLEEGDRGAGVVERLREVDPDVPVVAVCDGMVDGVSCVHAGSVHLEVWAALLEAVQPADSATHEHQA